MWLKTNDKIKRFISKELITIFLNNVHTALESIKNIYNCHSFFLDHEQAFKMLKPEELDLKETNIFKYIAKRKNIS